VGFKYDCRVDADDVAPEAPEQELMSFLSVVGGTIEGKGYRLVWALSSTAFNKHEGNKVVIPLSFVGYRADSSQVST
jgi:hypothetical protein